MTVLKEHLISSVDLEVLHDAESNQYLLAYQGRPVKLSGFNEHARHDRWELVSHIIDEMDIQGKILIRNGEIEEPRFIGSYSLMSIQKAYVEKGASNLETELVEAISKDPIHVSYHPPEEIERLPRLMTVFDYLDGLGLKRFVFDWIEAAQDLGLDADEASVAAYGHGDSSGQLRETMLKQIPETYVDGIRATYRRLTTEQQTVVTMLTNVHGSISWALALVSLSCSSTEYARGVSASLMQSPAIVGDINAEEGESSFRRLLQDAEASLTYLRLTESEVAQLVRKGESVNLEFKSSLRWDIRENKKNGLMTDEVLRAIAALMNSEGGQLLVGVEDNGNPVGIEVDQFDSTDKALLFLKDKVKSWLGLEAVTLMQPRLQSYRGVTVLIVGCPKCSSPVYFRGKKKKKNFFMRQGPSSAKLDGDDLENYLRKRFGIN